MSTTNASKAAERRMDWSMAPRGPVSATILSSVGLMALAGVGHVTHIDPVWGGIGAGVGMLGHVIGSTHRDLAPSAIVYRLGGWLGAGGWLTWTFAGHGHHHWWNQNSLAALAIGAVGFGLMKSVANRTRTKRGKPGTTVELHASGKLGTEWEARFLRTCRIKVKVTAVKRWKNGAGYDVHCLLPPGPATRGRIAAACEALATDARLPDGCGCEPKPPQPGSHRGEFVLAVSTVNRLGVRGDEHPPKLHYPADYSARSILQLIGLGEHRDSSVAGVQLREDSMLVTGRKGGGKTNLLDVTTLGICRCKDALAWHIDLNGGGMSQFWLHPWLQGEADRPPIDWAASTPEEALLMVTIALAIAKDRKTSYRTFKAQANVKLLPISEDLPEIVIMVDEGAEALAPGNRNPITRQVRDGLEELQRIGRNEAVNEVISTLRPIMSCISPDVLSQSAIRLGMFGLSAADLGHLYDWPRGISMDDLPVKGTTFITTMPDVPRPMKAYFLEPTQIKEAAVQVAGYRPDLDAASTEVANAEYAINLGGKTQVMAGIYAGRYGRMRQAFTGQNVLMPVIETAQERPLVRAGAGTAAAPRSPLRVVTSGGGAASWPAPRRATQPTTNAGPATSWPDPPRGRRSAMPPQPRQLPPPEQPPVPDLLARALQAFDAAGDHRLHSKILAGALGMTKDELAPALRPYGVRSRPKFMRGGEELRGYYREDIETAADRIARGEKPIPAEPEDQTDD